jgi:hypothetical protein
MKNVEIEIYISNLIRFFETNKNDLLDLIGSLQKDEFYERLRQKSEENYQNGEDIILTKQQIVDIVVDMKIPKINDNIETINKTIMKTKFGDIILN